MNALIRLSLALLTLVILFPAAAAADTRDEEAIEARAIEFAVAWNKHDAKAMSMLWAEDGDLINPFGRIARGRPEIERLFADEHGTYLKDTMYKLDLRWIRMVTADVAVATWDATISGMRTAEGDDMAPLDHMVTVVVVKRDGKWWTVSARPMVPVPPPAPVPGDLPASSRG